MQCIEIKNRIDDYADNLLPEHEQVLVYAHLSDCLQCRRLMKEHQAYLDRVSSYEVPAPESGMAARLLHNVRLNAKRDAERRAGHEAPGREQHHFFRGFAAASMMAVLLLGGYALLPRTAEETLTMVQLGAQVRPVDIVINVPANMPGTTLTVSLPEEMVLEDYNGSHELVWEVDLVQGGNMLTLPVRLIGDPQGFERLYIDVVLNYQEKVKQFQIGVDFDAPLGRDQGVVLPPLSLPKNQTDIFGRAI